MKFKKLIKFFLCFTFSACFINSSYAQVGVNTEAPDYDTDLTLGSTDKGFLPNKVELRAYSDPYPLSTNIKNGTIVYNTKTVPPISEGLYFWQDDSWHFLRSSDYKRQDFLLMSFKETSENDTYTIPYGKDIELTSLKSSFTVPHSGNIMVRAVIYVKSFLSTATIVSVGNTFFRFQITDLTTNTVLNNFVAACTPMSFPNGSGSGGVNNNPFSATALNSQIVEEDHEYEIQVFGQEGWNSSLTITAGTYLWHGYQANSVVQVDFVSDPY